MTWKASKYGVIVYGASALEPATCYQATRKGITELALGNETLKILNNICLCLLNGNSYTITVMNILGLVS